MKRKVFFLFLALLLLADLTYGQCAMCKKVVQDASEDSDMSVGQQLNTGILYLMAIPYIIFIIAFRKKIIGFLRELRMAGRH